MAKACLQKSRLLNWSFLLLISHFLTSNLAETLRQQTDNYTLESMWDRQTRHSASVTDWTGRRESSPIETTCNQDHLAKSTSVGQFPQTWTSNIGRCSFHFICCQSFIYENLYCIHFNGLYLATVGAHYDIIGNLSALCIINPDCCPVCCPDTTEKKESILLIGGIREPAHAQSAPSKLSR